MAISELAFSPTDGWNNTTSFPREPSNEAAVRTLLQSLHGQTRDYINKTLLAALIATTSGTSGADQIGAGVLYDGDTSNATVMAKLIYLREQIHDIVKGVITDNSITTDKLVNAAVTTEKINDTAVTLAKLSSILQSRIYSEDAAYNAFQAVLASYKANAGAIIPTRGLFFDGFLNTSLIDTTNTDATITSGYVSTAVSDYVGSVSNSTRNKYYYASYSQTCSISFTSPSKSGYAIKELKVWLDTANSPAGTLIVGLRSSPDGSDLTTASMPVSSISGGEYTISFGTAYSLTPNTTYYLSFYLDTSSSGYVYIGDVANGVNQSSVYYGSSLQGTAYMWFSVNFLLPTGSLKNLVAVTKQLNESYNCATLYVRRSSAGTLSIDPYVGFGTSPSITLTNMTKDTSYVSPTYSNGDKEERWTMTPQGSTGNYIAAQLHLYGGYSTEYISSYGFLLSNK